MIVHPSDPQAIWKPTPPGLRFTVDHIDVWRCTTHVPPEEHAYLAGLLSDEEKQKAARLRDPLKRAESEISRGMLRDLLSRSINTEAHKLVFNAGPHGKPYLTDQYHGKRIGFNISHTKGCILIAIGLNRDIGIDVEWLPPDFHWQPVARQFMSPMEVEHLSGVPPEDQCRAFFIQWVRSEAILKATGIGIVHGLTPPSQTGHEGDWSTTDLNVGPDHVAAVAGTGSAYALRLWLPPKLL